MIHIGMGGRAVEGTGLENRQGFTPLVGSNPTPSANCDGSQDRADRRSDRPSLDAGTIVAARPY
jgi:hypothetical protein